LVTIFLGASFNLHSLKQEQAKACAPIMDKFLKLLYQQIRPTTLKTSILQI